MEQVARAAAFALRQAQGRERSRTAVCVFSVTVGSTNGYSTAVSKLRRLFHSDRYFFITARLLERRTKLIEPDFVLLARSLNRARTLHPVYLTVCVFLPDHSPVFLPPLYVQSDS